jgi:chorismate synthase
MHADRRLNSILAGAVMSIPGIKSVGFGMAENSAEHFGSEVHDRIVPDDSNGGVMRATNHAGGMEGGMSTGEPIVIHAAMKPLSSLSQPLDTVDMATGRSTAALKERSDVCAVPAASITGEAVCLLALMNPFLEKFGGDSMLEIKRHWAATPGAPWA